MRKQVLKVEMFGRTLVVRQVAGADYEFRVYEVFPDLRNDHHLESFESFSEAWTFVEAELFGGEYIR